MAELTFAIKLEGTDITPYLKIDGGYKVQYEQLWSDANRTMQGNLKATYKGIVPKITLTFRQLTKTELSTVLAILNTSSITTQWWDENSDTYKTGEFYKGQGGEISLRDMGSKKYSEFSVNLIAFDVLS